MDRFVSKRKKVQEETRTYFFTTLKASRLENSEFTFLSVPHSSIYDWMYWDHQHFNKLCWSIRFITIVTKHYLERRLVPICDLQFKEGVQDISFPRSTNQNFLQDDSNQNTLLVANGILDLPSL